MSSSLRVPASFRPEPAPTGAGTASRSPGRGGPGVADLLAALLLHGLALSLFATVERSGSPAESTTRISVAIPRLEPTPTEPAPAEPATPVPAEPAILPEPAVPDAAAVPVDALEASPEIQLASPTPVELPATELLPVEARPVAAGPAEARTAAPPLSAVADAGPAATSVPAAEEPAPSAAPPPVTEAARAVPAPVVPAGVRVPDAAAELHAPVEIAARPAGPDGLAAGPVPAAATSEPALARPVGPVLEAVSPAPSSAAVTGVMAETATESGTDDARPEPAGVADAPAAELAAPDPATMAAAPVPATPAATVPATAVPAAVRIAEAASRPAAPVEVPVTSLADEDVSIADATRGVLPSGIPPALPSSAAISPEAVGAALAGIDCGRVSAAPAGNGGRLRVDGHVPDEETRAALLGRLRAVPGVAAVDAAGLALLPRPHCSTIERMARLGIPASTDQDHDLPAAGRAGKGGQIGTLHFTAGQAVDIRLTAPDYPAYVYVDYFDAEGRVLHLMPNAQIAGRKFAPAQAFNIGDRPGFEMKVSPPYGLDLVVATAVSQPLFSRARPVGEDAQTYLRDLEAAIARARRNARGFRAEYAYLFVVTGE